MSIWAKPGLKCVCIDGNWPDKEMDIANVVRAPMLNEVLTISAVNSTGCLQFVEIPAETETPSIMWSVFWEVSHFRPLITLKDDVALFRHHLAGASAGADA